MSHWTVMQLGKVHDHFRDATDGEIKELKTIALQEHARLGLDEPRDVVLQIRVQHLARERGLRIPGASQRQGTAPRPRRKECPNYLQAGLEQQAQQCAKDRRGAKLKKHIRIVRKNTDRFYLFCFLKGGFARAVCRCRALEVFTALIEQLSGDIETWVSIETLAWRLRRTPKTVSKALRELESKKIVSLTSAAGRNYGLNGKPILKNQGYIIQLHSPMFWDWDSIGGVPDEMKKYLADYESIPVDNSETQVAVTGLPA